MDANRLFAFSDRHAEDGQSKSFPGNADVCVQRESHSTFGESSIGAELDRWLQLVEVDLGLGKFDLGDLQLSIRGRRNHCRKSDGGDAGKERGGSFGDCQHFQDLSAIDGCFCFVAVVLADWLTYPCGTRSPQGTTV